MIILNVKKTFSKSRRGARGRRGITLHRFFRVKNKKYTSGALNVANFW